MLKNPRDKKEAEYLTETIPGGRLHKLDGFKRMDKVPLLSY